MHVNGQQFYCRKGKTGDCNNFFNALPLGLLMNIAVGRRLRCGAA